MAAMLLIAITLTPQDLYNGFDARKVLLVEKGAKLALDARAIKSKSPGIIVTDPIDLGKADGLVGVADTPASVSLEVAAETPEGAAVTVEVRSGDNCLDTSKWSDWTKLAGLAGNVDKLAGRYAQVRITLTAAAADRLPAVQSLKLAAKVGSGRAWAGKVAIAEEKIQKIVRSPIEFVYERPDTPKLAAFRKAAKLDEVVARGGQPKDDFEKLVKLMDWAGGCQNIRGTGREEKGGVYQWDIDTIFEVKDGKPTIYGHCMSFSEALVTAATAMGYVGSRHMAMDGFRDASHEVCDIWVPSMGKWVYFDPSLTQYYFDKQTKAPMNLIEMHTLVADKFVPAGKDMNWFRQRGNAEGEEVKAKVKEVGGQAHIGSRLGPWKYGEPMPADYDWGWYHGYLAAGFVQMTPRNDFNSNPAAMSKKFQHLPGYDNYPTWVDAKTPPRTNNWYTRMRDFYWTLDQASFKLVQAEEGVLRVELGQSMPFFKSYQLKVDGAEVKDAGSPFTWKLKAGANKLEVAPVDDFGKVGLPSSVTANYTAKQ